MSLNPTPLNVREHSVITVFDHSGTTPRAIEEIDVLFEGGRRVSNMRRTLSTREASERQAERLGGGRMRRTSEYVREDWRRTVEDARAMFALVVGKKERHAYRAGRS